MGLNSSRCKTPRDSEQLALESHQRLKEAEIRAGCNSVRCPDSECTVFINSQEPLDSGQNCVNGMVVSTDHVTRKKDCTAQCPYTFVGWSTVRACFVESDRTTLSLGWEPRSHRFRRSYPPGVAMPDRSSAVPPLQDFDCRSRWPAVRTSERSLLRSASRSSYAPLQTEGPS
jgi:hypothetical protein